jgi:hypothetical protein
VPAQDATQQPYATKVRQDCAQLFILYTGMAGRMMIPPMQFIQETRLIDRNLVIIRDLNQCCYQRGISPALPTMHQFLSWQQELVQKFRHVSEVYCIGSSGGAYASLLSGHFLKASKVWAFAPPVTVEVSERISYVDPEYCNVAKVLQTDNGKTQYEIYYNEAEEGDRLAAEQLASLPGVSAFAQPGKGHGVIVHLAKEGKLAGLLPAFKRCS